MAKVISHLNTLSITGFRIDFIEVRTFFSLYEVLQDFVLFFCYFLCSSIVVFGKNLPKLCCKAQYIFTYCAIELMSEICLVNRLDRVVEIKPTYIL